MAKQLVIVILSLLIVIVAKSKQVSEPTLGHFWQLTDTHLHREFKAGSNSKKLCSSGTGNVGRFGSFKCDTPPETLASALSRITVTTNSTPAPDFIFWTGDHISVQDVKSLMSKSATLAYIQNITDALRITAASFLPQKKVRVFPILGNHDVCSLSFIQLCFFKRKLISLHQQDISCWSKYVQWVQLDI